MSFCKPRLLDFHKQNLYLCPKFKLEYYLTWK